jgi:hypothetical protein
MRAAESLSPTSLSTTTLASAETTHFVTGYLEPPHALEDDHFQVNSHSVPSPILTSSQLPQPEREDRYCHQTNLQIPKGTLGPKTDPAKALFSGETPSYVSSEETAPTHHLCEATAEDNSAKQRQLGLRQQAAPRTVRTRHLQTLTSGSLCRDASCSEKECSHHWPARTIC